MKANVALGWRFWAVSALTVLLFVLPMICPAQGQDPIIEATVRGVLESVALPTTTVNITRAIDLTDPYLAGVNRRTGTVVDRLGDGRLGPLVAFTRDHLNLPGEGPGGTDWRLALDEEVFRDVPTDTFTLKSPWGPRRYKLNVDGRYHPENGKDGTTIQAEKTIPKLDDCYLWQNASFVKRVYCKTPRGYLLSHGEAPPEVDGGPFHEWQITRDDKGNAVRVEDSRGRTVEILYYEPPDPDAGRIRKIRYKGLEWNLLYSGGKLRYFNFPPRVAGGAEPIEEIQYAADGMTHLFPDGTSLRYTWNADGIVSEITGKAGSTVMSQVRMRWDAGPRTNEWTMTTNYPLGQVGEQYTFQTTINRLVRVRTPDGRATTLGWSPTEPDKLTEWRAGDPLADPNVPGELRVHDDGRLQSVQRLPDNQMTYQVTAFQAGEFPYDRMPETVVTPDQVQITYEWDGLNHLASVSALGNTTQTQRVLDTGLAQITQIVNGQTQGTVRLDAHNDWVELVRADGVTASAQRNPEGFITQTTDFEGRVRNYDNLTAWGLPQGVTEAGQPNLTLGWDNMLNLVSAGDTVTSIGTGYTPDGRPTSLTTTTGSTTRSAQWNWGAGVLNSEGTNGLPQVIYGNPAWPAPPPPTFP